MRNEIGGKYISDFLTVVDVYNQFELHERKGTAQAFCQENALSFGSVSIELSILMCLLACVCWYVSVREGVCW